MYYRRVQAIGQGANFECLNYRITRTVQAVGTETIGKGTNFWVVKVQTKR